MSRVFTWATVPMLLVCMSFDTPYIDICLFALLIIPIIRTFMKKPMTGYVIAAIFTIAAFCMCQNVCDIAGKSFYPLIDKPITLECTINGAPSYSNGKATYPVKMLSANYKGKVHPLTDNAIVYCDCYSENAIAEYGDRLEFKTVLNLPQGSGITSGNSYLLGQGRLVTCYTEDFAVTNHDTWSKAPRLTLGIYRLRDYLTDKCDRYFSTDISAFVKAVLLGEKSNIPADINEDITRSGISHIISVSGLHLSLIIIISSSFLRTIGFEKLKYRHIVMAVLSIICGVFAAVVTGFSPSVRRAMLMLIAANSSILLGRDRDSVNALSFALLVLLMANPFAIYDVRLSLSATAVLGIILFSPLVTSLLRRFIREGYLSNLIAMTLSAQLLSTPITVMYFGTFSAVSPLTNIIAVPLMFPLMLLGLIFLISPFSIISGLASGGMWLIIQVIFKVADFASSLPFALGEIGIGTYLRILAFLITLICGIRLIIFCKNNAKRFICLIGAGAVMFTSLAYPFGKSFKIDFISLNQGECSLVQIDNNINLLIDCGNYHDNEHSASSIKGYITKQSLYKIDFLLLSSITEGSVYNFISLADKVKIDSVIIPDYLTQNNYKFTNLLLKEAEKRKINVYEMHKGDTFTINKRASVSIHSPDSEIKGCAGNMVFDLSYGGKKILFLGNADSYDNQMLLESIGEYDFDIVKLSGKSKYPHTDEALIRAISPHKVFAFNDSFNDENYIRLKEFLYNKNITFYPIGSVPPHIAIKSRGIEITEGEELEEYKRTD